MRERKQTIHKSKRVPSFWVDFDWRENELVGMMIECDDPKHPVIIRVPEFEQAHKIVEELNSGRVDYRKMAAITERQDLSAKQAA